MPTAILNAKYQVTLPAKIRKALDVHLKDGIHFTQLSSSTVCMQAHKKGAFPEPAEMLDGADSVALAPA